MRNLRIAELLFNRPLMIAKEKLDVLLHVFGQRAGIDLIGLPAVEAVAMDDRARARAGYQVHNGIGIIGIHGPLMHRVLAMDFPSGGPTTYADIRRAFDTALADDGVQGIVLDLDSPGGEVNGAFDLADHIFQARGIKPLTAVINESAFSAAYLLASAADKIVVPRTGVAGSIGVIATHADFSRAEDAAGITVTHIFAGARKADFSPHRPLDAEAARVLQEMVDGTYDLFVETVARNRGLSTGEVRDTQAAIFEGHKAVTARLADEVAAVDRAIATARKGKGTKLIAAASARTREKTIMNVQELRETHPDLVAQVETEARQGMISKAEADAGRTEAITAERTRALAILGMPGPAAQAHRDLLIQGIEAGQSAGDVALAIQHKEAELLGKMATGMKEGAPPAAPAAEPGGATVAEAQAAVAGEEMVKAAAAWNARN
ncbi:S49 family peptidase [Desulfobulbus elongatus]|uniref:S49 family peptidase n=1 Tax=Desulfobulbus elongatus TaxID=53332 RepID=UPI0006862072|nr:S49 family peptidase [Desulfobulbus elongatus]